MMKLFATFREVRVPRKAESVLEVELREQEAEGAEEPLFSQKWAEVPGRMSERLAHQAFFATARNVFNGLAMLRDLRRYLDESRMEIERLVASVESGTRKKFEPKSFWRSPFALVDSCPAALIPSPWRVPGPGVAWSPPSDSFETFGPSPLTSARDLFLSYFPGVRGLESATLVRLDIRVPVVVARFAKMMRIVFGAEIVGGELELRPIPSPSVSESFRLHLFGNFTLFLGHYVMELRRDDVYLARPYSLAGVPGAFEIFRLQCWQLRRTGLPRLAGKADVDPIGCRRREAVAVARSEFAALPPRVERPRHALLLGP
jgi:hypothetical protein